MNLTAWVVFFCTVAFTLSQKVELCKNETKDCVPGSIMFFGSNPQGSAKYKHPNPISLSCSFTGEVVKVLWIRNASDGESKILNSTSFGPSPIFPSVVRGRLHDLPKDNKFPYTYQCIAFGKCCVELRSQPITIIEAVPEINIHDIRPSEFTTVYSGYGKVSIICIGEGDNFTRVYWNRTDESGNIMILNSTTLEHKSGGIWNAELTYRPDPLNVSYTYNCVAENKCCPTVISDPKKIPFNHGPFICESNPFGVLKPLDQINVIPNKRSAKITWKYDHDPEDTGFVIDLGRSLKKVFNLTVREYVFNGLVPNTVYVLSHQILYRTREGRDCQTFPSSNTDAFRTLPDVPSQPRNVTVMVERNTLNVSWVKPKFINGNGLFYTIYWRKVGVDQDYTQRNVTENPYVIRDLAAFSTYHIKVQAVNVAGIGGSSGIISVSTQEGPEPYIRIIRIISRVPTLNYTGFGKVKVSCIGEGDNATKVQWIRTDKDGNNISLSTTNYPTIFGVRPKWEADLLDRPNTTKFPYTYQCIVNNNCCQTKMSSLLTIGYSPTPDKCPPVIKPIPMDVTPNKRSVRFNWQYDPDPEDTSFKFIVSPVLPEAILNVTAREFTVRGLEPNKTYDFTYSILYGKGCEERSYVREFTTLPDYPSRPRNVTVIPEGITLNVSWLPPEYLNGEFRHYILSSNKIDENFSASVNVTTLTTSFLLEDLEELRTYLIRVFAVNNVGIGESSFVVSAQTEQLPNKAAIIVTDDSTNTGAIVGGLIGAILFIILLLLIILHQRRRTLQIKERENSVELFHSMRRIDNPNAASNPETKHDSEPDFITDEISYIVLLEDWEIAPDKLQVLDKKLGGGQFGIVKQGLLTSGKGDPELVAVKMLKAGAKESDLQDLMTELTILKEVNKVPHPNVIRLIGGCSIGGKLHVITELCSGGSLRRLLINSRVYPSEENASNYINLSSTLNHRQLVKIAADIANGMVHLSSQKFVHRDLAARNILIGEDNMAKVSDFGLARDVGGAEEYIRNNQNLLPVKWMALESLLDGRFTVASDVWSYGVLLHEITTLGEEPYKDISPYNIVSHVGSGCRMPQSPQCSDEIYEIMTNCWKVEPAERPTFEDIHVTLQNMLVDNEKSYINIAHVVDEGTLAPPPEPKNESIKDGSVRYTKA